MNSLRVKQNIYRIEVNDKGECIEFNIDDIGLRAKLYQALDDINALEKKYTEKVEQAKSDKECALLENEMFNEARKIMDSFLGAGACQKIFGDINYIEMFSDLFNELARKRKELGGKSHLDMMKISAQATNKKIMNKYSKNSKKVI